MLSRYGPISCHVINMWCTTHVYINCIQFMTILLYRLLLAALHYNENSNRRHADGDQRYKVVYPKFKQGGYSVRPIQVDPTFSKYPESNIFLEKINIYNMHMALLSSYRVCEHFACTYLVHLHLGG